MTSNLAHRQCSPASLIIVATLLLTGCSPKPHQTLTPSDKKFRDAIAIAQIQVAKYAKVPNCRSGGPQWRYSIREEGDFIIATLGPTNPKEPHFTVKMRENDLAVVGTKRLS